MNEKDDEFDEFELMANEDGEKGVSQPELFEPPTVIAFFSPGENNATGKFTFQCLGFSGPPHINTDDAVEILRQMARDIPRLTEQMEYAALSDAGEVHP